MLPSLCFADRATNIYVLKKAVRSILYSNSIQIRTGCVLNWKVSPPGLKKCPSDTFLPHCVRAPSSNPIMHQKKRGYLRYPLFFWCERWDSNPHGDHHTHLKRACLPFQHSRKSLRHYNLFHIFCQSFFLYSSRNLRLS